MGECKSTYTFNPGIEGGKLRCDKHLKGSPAAGGFVHSAYYVGHRFIWTTEEEDDDPEQ